MEDYLITIKCDYIDTMTGEVLFSTQFSKPMSVLVVNTFEYTRYFDSFFRGVRQGKHVAVIVTIVNDRELPKVVQQNICF